MAPGLRVLLESLIDYAGLFPPASLPLGESIRRFLSYLGEDGAWMLGRFVCPAARLPELAREHGELFYRGPRFAISTLARSGNNTEEFLTNLLADRLDLETFVFHRQTAYVDVDMLEVRLPPDALDNAERQERILAALLETRLGVFVEAPADRGTLPGLLDRLQAAGQGEKMVGFKLRCGGPEARAFPSSAAVAFALSACVSRGVPFKATAGLHHPLPRFDAGVGARMHGFVNLFAAGVLALALGVEEETIRSILDDADPGHFEFGAEGFRWKELRADRQEIEAGREAVLSVGSCSFEEPREDLRALGWW
jgi:hypothetical protein